MHQKHKTTYSKQTKKKKHKKDLKRKKFFTKRFHKHKKAQNCLTANKNKKICTKNI